MLLLLVIHQTGYLGTSNATLSKAVALVQTYSKWSFSIGIDAVFLASMVGFATARLQRRGAPRASDLHPLRDPRSEHRQPCAAPAPFRSRAHRAASLLSGWIMGWVEGAIVFLAFNPILRHRLATAMVVAAARCCGLHADQKGLLMLYARAVIRLVMSQVS